MARRLTDKPSTLAIIDNLTNTDILFTYRMPTTKERTAYQNMAVKRKRNKLDFKTIQARQKFGLDILLGIREGDFEIEKKGKFVTIGSEEGSKAFDPDWKLHVEKHAMDLVMLLAAQVFEGSAEIDGDAQD